MAIGKAEAHIWVSDILGPVTNPWFKKHCCRLRMRYAIWLQLLLVLYVT
jgi:hypothetical protein